MSIRVWTLEYVPFVMGGSKEVHSKEYGKPTMDCIKYLKDQIRHDK